MARSGSRALSNRSRRPRSTRTGPETPDITSRAPCEPWQFGVFQQFRVLIMVYPIVACVGLTWWLQMT